MTNSRPVQPPRVHQRKFVQIPVSYSYSFEDKNQIKSIANKGISLNLSEGGICIYTNIDLKEGMSLAMYGEAAWNGIRKGYVVWRKMISQDLFRVGIKLLS